MPSLLDGVHEAIKVGAERLEAGGIKEETALAGGMRRSAGGGAALLGEGDLLVLAEEFANAPIPVTQEELGLMSGTTRPTVNEVLRDLERQGAVRLSRGRIMVLDAPGLQRRLDRALGH